MQIRRTKYDLAIDPCDGSQSSRLFTAMAHSTYVIGMHRNESTTNDSHRCPNLRQAPRHMAMWPVFLLRSFISSGHSGFDFGYPSLDIRLSTHERRTGRQILNASISAQELPRLIGIFADARGAKRFDEAWWMRFIDALQVQTPGFAIFEIAPPDGRSRLSSRFPVFFSPNVREVAAVISEMACFISADCGAMHLGSASGTPTIGLFSVTDASKYAPYGNGSQAIDTHGKSPEEVARPVGAIIQGLRTSRVSSTSDEPFGDSPARNSGQSKFQISK